MLASQWLYSGGVTGARTLLGAVASSTISVAGTVFSITIAALSLAAGQMGPRLLRNFVRDRGNQAALGIFLGTFAYSLMVLRSVRTLNEGDFIPHLALSVDIALAMVCVGTLVFFVGHMAQRINVDVVIELVSADVNATLRRLAPDAPPQVSSKASSWDAASVIRDKRQGYLKYIDSQTLADWAHAQNVRIKLLARAGDYVFPNAPIALLSVSNEEAAIAIERATAVGSQRSSADDIEYAVRQLVEVAVRALSPGINDPHTAISVLDRLGGALCELAARHLPKGQVEREGVVVVSMPSVDYDGLTDTMFHLIRQNAAQSVTVLIRLIDVLSSVATVERDVLRLNSLQRHASNVLEDAKRADMTSADFQDLQMRVHRFEAIVAHDVDALRLALD